MIPLELEAKILRLSEVEKWPPGTIASVLCVHHEVVERVLASAGVLRPKIIRPRMVDPYLPFMEETLTKYPKLCASRLYDMVRERGYPGRPDHFRHLVAALELRPIPVPEAFLRLRGIAGEDAQVDWGHFGKILIGRASHQLLAFVMVLSWSRMIFLRFYLGGKMENFLRGHQDAFVFFGGVPRRLLYDNLKSAVLQRIGESIRFNPTLLEFASHYRYEPRPVAPYRGNEKGRVERAIRYVRTRFFPARKWKDLEDLNAQAKDWCLGIAADRRWVQDSSRTVKEVFAEEVEKLRPLPADPFPTEERVEVKARKTPYVRFDRNDYSIPHTRVGKTLVVMADLETVRILDGSEVVAEHSRSFDKEKLIEDEAHIKSLRKWKQKAKRESGKSRLLARLPVAEKLLDGAAFRGDNLGGVVSSLLKYLEMYKLEWIEEAIQHVLDKGTPRVASIRFLLEKRSQNEGLPPPLNLKVSEHPKLQDSLMTPHDLGTYDILKEE